MNKLLLKLGLHQVSILCVSASSEVEYIKEFFEVELDHSGSELIRLNRKNCELWKLLSILSA